MDKPIRVGDLVVVARPTPCGCNQAVGAIFRVTDFITGPAFRCRSCGFRWDIGHATGVLGYLDFQLDPRRLNRIPPPEELGIVNEREEIAA